MLANDSIIVVPIHSSRTKWTQVSPIESQRRHYAKRSQECTKQPAQERSSFTGAGACAGHNVRDPRENQNQPDICIDVDVDVHFSRTTVETPQLLTLIHRSNRQTASG
jgi:hypothetical protein